MVAGVHSQVAYRPRHAWDFTCLPVESDGQNVCFSLLSNHSLYCLLAFVARPHFFYVVFRYDHDKEFVQVSVTRLAGSKSGFVGSTPHSFSTSVTNLLKSPATESERGVG